MLTGNVAFSYLVIYMKGYNEVHYWSIKAERCFCAVEVSLMVQTCFVHAILLFAFPLGNRNVVDSDVSLKAVSTDTFEHHLTKKNVSYTAVSRPWHVCSEDTLVH